jgi:hypothetical protein
MAPIIMISERRLFSGLSQLDWYESKAESKPAKIRDNDFIYVPSIGLYVAKKRTHYGKNWYEAHEALAKEGSRMLTIPEFVNLLNYLRENPSRKNNKIFNDITRNFFEKAEWLDAYFEQRKNRLWVLTGNKTKAEKLEECLMENRIYPGISLDNWLKNPTSQGLPRSKISEGHLDYSYPRNNTVAKFSAVSYMTDLSNSEPPTVGDSNLGVRAAKRE